MRFAKYLALIGVVLFLFILYSVGPAQVFESLVQLNPVRFAAVLVLLSFILLLKGWKQKVLLQGLGREIGLLESTKIWMIGFFFATITPAKAGDFFRTVYLKKAIALPVGEGIAAILVERLLDVAYLFITGIIGMLLFSIHFSLDFSIVVALFLFLLLFLATVFVLTRKPWVSFLLKPLFNLFLPERFKQRLRNSFHDFYAGIQRFSLSRGKVGFAGLLTIVIWIMTIFQYWLLAFALSLPVSLEFMFWVMPAILLVEVLPISFAGLGTRDAASIFFLSFASIGAGQAVSFALVVFFVNLIMAVPGVLFLNRRDKEKASSLESLS